MATAFRPVNHFIPPSLSATSAAAPMITESKTDDMLSPPTPRAPSAGRPGTSQTPFDDSKTPTRSTFASPAASMSSQRPLPSSPFPQAVQVPEPLESSHKTPLSQPSATAASSEDVDMDGTDQMRPSPDASTSVISGSATDIIDENGASDGESVNADGSRSGKKKKSQRFYCTDYPPCNLSFTRSEHLARHIRKHTGERPFQCHCSRRFSRLDNLRQHAQTVHVNEDIPQDSLAATGSRFQRQIRSDRGRPTGRARSSTGGPLMNPVRGHSKSLSTSSIASVSSIASAYGPREDLRHRPPPLVVDSRRSMESYRSSDSPYSAYLPNSPGDFSTPTSSTFSTGQSSPRWSTIASPVSAHSRSQSMYVGTRPPVRRLSVPSDSSPGYYQRAPHPPAQPMYGPGSVHGSNPAPYTPPSVGYLSPLTPSSGWSERSGGPDASPSDESWRRRTWHPESRHNGNQSLPHNTMNPSQFHQNLAPMPASQSSVRLPGIESFDPFGPSPQRRNRSPRMGDSEMMNAPPPPPSAETAAEERRNLPQWDMGLHRGLTRLDITSKNSTPPRDSSQWDQTDRAAPTTPTDQHGRPHQPTVHFNPESTSAVVYEPAGRSRAAHPHALSAPAMVTPRESKRHGWYQGPPSSQSRRPAPVAEDYHAEIRASRVDRMVHPNVAAFSGFPARDAPQPQSSPVPPPPNHHQQGNPDPLRRLEALVAVATSEGSTAAAY